MQRLPVIVLSSVLTAASDSVQHSTSVNTIINNVINVKYGDKLST